MTFGPHSSHSMPWLNILMGDYRYEAIALCPFHDACNMQVNEGLDSLLRSEEGNIFLIVLEEVLCQDGRTLGPGNNGEVILMSFGFILCGTDGPLSLLRR